MKVPINLKSFKKVLRNFNHFSNGFLEGEIELDLPDQKQADWNQTDNTQVDFIKNKPMLPNYKIILNQNVTAPSGQIRIEDITKFTFLEFYMQAPTSFRSFKIPLTRIEQYKTYIGYDGTNLSDSSGNNAFYLYEGFFSIQGPLPTGEYNFEFVRQASVGRLNNATTWVTNDTTENMPRLYMIVGIY